MQYHTIWKLFKTWKVWTNKDELWAIIDEFGSVEAFRKQAEAYNNAWPRQRIRKIEKLNTSWVIII